MVKNKTGGSKHKKMASKFTKNVSKGLSHAEAEEEKYAVVTKFNGNTFDALCDDGVTRRVFLQGKFKGRNKRDNKIEVSKMVLVGVSDINHHILLYVYNDGDVTKLQNEATRDIKPLLQEHSKKHRLDDSAEHLQMMEDSNIEFVDETTLEYHNLRKSTNVETISKLTTVDEDGNESDDSIDFDNI